jgi:hypothetical protein
MMLKSPEAAEGSQTHPAGSQAEDVRGGGINNRSAEHLSLEPEAGPCSASGQWQLMSAELDSRAYWWEKAVFGWESSSIVQTPFLNGHVDASLGLQAVVCCFMLGLDHGFVQIAGDALRSTDLPQMENQSTQSDRAVSGNDSYQEQQRFGLTLLEHALDLKRISMLQICKEMSNYSMSKGLDTLPYAWLRVFPFIRRMNLGV